MILKEGGNVFDDAIEFDHKLIPGLVGEINKVLDKTGVKGHPIGSGATPTPGKKSGDLDIMVDQDVLADHFGIEPNTKKTPLQVKKALEQLYQGAGFDTSVKGVNVHVRVPIDGGSAQVDLMVVPHAEMVARFHTHDIPKGSPYKGKNKQIALSYLAKQKGYKWNAWKGLINRETDEFVSRDLDEIAKLIIGDGASAKDLGSVESIMNALPKDQAQEMLDYLRQDPNWQELPKQESLGDKHLNRIKQLINY